jgi:hypothetical protein
MRWLTRLLQTRDLTRQHGERGAITALVAVLFAGGAILGMLALTVDVGNIMLERRELQNGADATAMALAQACAKTPIEADCTSPASANLSLLGSQNSFTKLSGTAQMQAISSVCGNNIAALPPCTETGDYSQVAKCLPPPPWVKATTPYVETRTVTSTNAKDPGPLTSFFAKPLAGLFGQTYTDQGYTACSRAAAGPLGQSKLTMPIVLGLCNWNVATTNGTNFAASPPYTPAPNTTTPPLVPASLQPFITTIFGHVNGSETDVLRAKVCQPDLSAPPPGPYTPGGFGWVKTCADLGYPSPQCDGAPPCTAVFSSSGTVGASPGASPSSGCTAPNLAQYVGTEVDVPVITSVSGTGNNAVYTVAGISSFFLAGYKNLVSGVGDMSAYDGTGAAYRLNTCDPGTPSVQSWKSECIWGWFTSPLRPVGSVDSGGGPPRGPTVISPAG